ncbi:hypothetical protein Kpol_299p8, partial [Vanderwaltozyma polyspora DSM 70294]
MTISKPQTWKEIGDIIASGDLGKLARTQESTDKYREFKRYILEELHSNLTDVLLSKLGWTLSDLKYCNDVMYSSDADKIKVAFSHKSLYELTVNDFPYNFEQN